MPNYTNPAERAYEEGRSTITAEEAVGLRGQTSAKKKKKESALKRAARLIRMLAMGGRYKSDYQRQLEKRQQKPYETVRTKAVTGGLREAGLTKEEIGRLRGK